MCEKSWFISFDSGFNISCYILLCVYVLKKKKLCKPEMLVFHSLNKTEPDRYHKVFMSAIVLDCVGIVW